MRSIFLSYVVNDKLFVSRLVKDLESLNCQVWQDCFDSFPNSTLLERLLSIQKRIDFIIVILSKSSIEGTIADSYWNDVKIDEALHGRNWLIPVLIHDSELPMYIFPDRVEDFRVQSTYRSAFQKLTTRILN